MAGGHNLANKMADKGVFELPDPGDGANIQVKVGKAVIGVVSAGASETNDLYPPGGVGWELILHHRTDGGSRIITCRENDGSTKIAINEANSCRRCKSRPHRRCPQR